MKMQSFYLCIQCSEINLIKGEITCHQNIKDDTTGPDICHSTVITFVTKNLTIVPITRMKRDILIHIKAK